jgi:hypothetical protein
MWWLTSFLGLEGETAGESRTSAMPELLTTAPMGHRGLVGGINVAVFTYLPDIL